MIHRNPYPGPIARTAAIIAYLVLGLLHLAHRSARRAPNMTSKRKAERS